MLQTLSVGTDPLRRSRDFRLLWLAAVPAGVAMGAVGLALFVQAYELTGSARTLGYLGLVQVLALLFGFLAGSSVVDHADRRLLLLATQAGFCLSVLSLLVGSQLGEPPMTLLYATSAFGSAAASLHFPTRTAMIPAVVDREELTTAMTLETVVWNATMIVGPILGGAVLARFGLSAVYVVGVGGHTVALLVQLALRRQPADERRAEGRLGLTAIRDGFTYLRPRSVLKGLLWVDLIAMAFGMRRALFPILAARQFGRGPEAVGLLMGAIPAGALVVAMTAGWIARIRRQGLGLVMAAAVWGVAVTAFGLSGAQLWLGLFLLAVGGGADIVAAILRASIIQHEVPESVRGRVWGINFLVLNGGPRLGDLTAGFTAAAWGASASVVTGGLTSLIGVGVFALAVPALSCYTSGDGVDPAERPPTPWRGET